MARMFSFSRSLLSCQSMEWRHDKWCVTLIVNKNGLLKKKKKKVQQQPERQYYSCRQLHGQQQGGEEGEEFTRLPLKISQFCEFFT